MEKKMNMELHAKGASFIAAQTSDNPRDLVIEALENMPDREIKDQFEQFRALLDEGGDSYQRAVDWYFFVNMRDYLVTARNRKDPIARTQRMALKREQIEAIKAQIVLLDLTMPNGKQMRDCTGAEMARFGNRYQKIAERVGKGKLVGAVLNEEQVRTIMK